MAMDTETLPLQIYKANNKRNVLLAMLGLVVLSTIAEWALIYVNNALQLIFILTAVGYTVAVLIWCNIDARERGITLGSGFRIAVILIMPVALIYYLFRSRGLTGGLLGILYAVGFYILMALTAVITNLILALISDRLHLFQRM